jgi:hypothetical protein
MKASPVILAALIASMLLAVIGFGGGRYLKASGQSTDARSNDRIASPSFLEKGKTYTFFVGASTGNQYGVGPVALAGRIEKIEPDSSWVYITNYTYMTVPKKKELVPKFEGNSWINTAQVYQCIEVKVSP